MGGRRRGARRAHGACIGRLGSGDPGDAPESRDPPALYGTRRFTGTRRRASFGEWSLTLTTATSSGPRDTYTGAASRHAFVPPGMPTRIDRTMGPLPSPPAAVDELERSVRDLGFAGAIVGTNVDGLDWDADELFPVLAAARDLNALIFVHPARGRANPFLRNYHLRKIGRAHV